MPRVKVEGTTLIVGKTRVDLRFLRTHREVAPPGRGTTPRVRVHCRGCRRTLAVGRVGLRVTAEGPGRATVDLQPHCVECRAILNARKVG
jgi:hypothetical protein